MVVDAVPEKIQFRHTETAFVGIDYNAVCSESLENSSQIKEVLLWGRASNEDIIDIPIG